MIFPSPLTVDNVTRIGEYVYPVGVEGTKSFWKLVNRQVWPGSELKNCEENQKNVKEKD